MAINLDAIRNKLNQLSGNGRSKNNMWRPPEDKEAIVRLLSFQSDDGLPFKELSFYYNIGNNRGLLAPFQFGKPDPIQELITKLREDGSKDSYELAKKLYPKTRYYAPVIVRGEEDKGVQIWGFGKQLYQAFLGVMLDEDYGDITDPTTGRDVKVTTVKVPGRQFPNTEILPRGSRTQLSDNKQTAKGWLDSIPKMDDAFELKSYAELEKIVNDWLTGDEGDSGSSTGFERKETTRGGTGKFADDDDFLTPSKTAATKQQDTGSKKYRSLDEAFSDLEDL
jgi:hypothetical protein